MQKKKRKKRRKRNKKKKEEKRKEEKTWNYTHYEFKIVSCPAKHVCKRGKKDMDGEGESGDKKYTRGSRSDEEKKRR